MSGREGQEAHPWPRSAEPDGRPDQRLDDRGPKGRMEHTQRDTTRLTPLSYMRCAVRWEASAVHKSCLVFNHPRSEGWSLHGQVYSIPFCLLSSSVNYSCPCCCLGY